MVRRRRSVEVRVASRHADAAPASHDVRFNITRTPQRRVRVYMECGGG